MAGRGGVVNDTWDRVVPPQCQPNPSIYRLSADLAWVPAREPLHIDIDMAKVTGVGPGMAFANAVLTRDRTLGTVGLVPCAIGGTSITQWNKGGYLYEQLVRRAKMAVQSGGAYAAMLWYQGESDTVNREDAELYKGRLEMFFTNLRSDLQAPSLPIFQVALASGEGPYIHMVREAQFGIDLTNVHHVDAKGLPLEPDGLHLSTPAQVTLGEKLADAFLQSIGTSSPSPLSSNDANTDFSSFVHCLLFALCMDLAFR
ncbi:hypothetical protein SLEP1_g16704 [Rubroshorea leprosula]|uniref:Sialate O-acetylesterase domain-containing protein n=1 Tax=Rubroshorea leprosula TaxID=152421 RepID=A0AAV5J2A5_9ROSI|nr:hypothetical protein SLEP1_g16704 [Rubroshorea leprosula]